ncbi:MAG: phage portal protein [Pseudomonadota bacterium]
MSDPVEAEVAGAPSWESFTFGEPESVIDRSEWLLMLEAVHNGKYYAPPISMIGLVKAHRMSSHHSSAIILKRNMLASTFRPSRLLSRAAFARMATDYLATGNAYLETIDNLAARPLELRPSPAVHTRVGTEAGTFFYLQPGKDDHEFRKNSVIHLLEPDLMQEVYGVPEWYAALQAGLLNEAATLFRRRYYLNGSHAGFIMYISEEGLQNGDSDAIREALRQSKGPGNFRNLYLHIPKGKKDGVQIIPVSEVAARDEFMAIKNCTRDDILAAHRVPPQLLGVVPTNSGGFGSISEAAKIFFLHEIAPLQRRFEEINDRLGVVAVAFDAYELPA